MKDFARIFLGGGFMVAVVLFVSYWFQPQTLGPHPKTRTKALISDVVIAVMSYRLEYAMLPADERNHRDVEIVFDGSPEGADHLQILIGEAVQTGSRENANPRKITFLEPDSSDGHGPGIVFEGDKAVRLLDAWGQPIHLMLDGNYDRAILSPDGSGKEIRKQVIAWSEGNPDEEDDRDAWKNNVTSWE